MTMINRMLKLASKIEIKMAQQNTMELQKLISRYLIQNKIPNTMQWSTKDEDGVNGPRTQKMTQYLMQTTKTNNIQELLEKLKTSTNIDATQADTLLDALDKKFLYMYNYLGRSHTDFNQPLKDWMADDEKLFHFRTGNEWDSLSKLQNSNGLSETQKQELNKIYLKWKNILKIHYNV